MTSSHLWYWYKISFVSISTLYIVNKIAEIYKKDEKKDEKKNAAKINKNKKNKIILSSNRLFQIRFIENNYSGLTKHRCHDCLFHVLTALGLRSYSRSIRDSNKIYKEKIDGVEVQDVANYLSIIFDENQANIETDYHYFKYFKNDLKYLKILKNLKNGYATFVCASFRNFFLPFDYFSRGHFFIIYKRCDEIYYYDPQNNFTTQNTNDFFKWFMYINVCIFYCNVNEREYPLIKGKLNSRIKY
jgi:hypothetical protein